MLNRLVIVSMLLVGCATPETDLCKRFYEPYPDHVSGRMRHANNGDFVDAMVAYSNGDHATAIEGFKRYLAKGAEGQPQVYIYYASSLLALGEPYDAELQLDFVERSNKKGFSDVVDWYNAMCWLCSDQHDRALEQARMIVAKPQHTYKKEAEALKTALGG